MARVDAGKPRGILRVGADAPVPGAHRRLLPAPDLAPFVEHFWCVRWDLRGQPAQTVATLPHPSVHLVVDGAAGHIGGVRTGRFTRVLDGEGEVFGIKFRPGGFRAFWPAPLSHLADVIVPLATAFDGEGADLLARITATDDFEARIDIAEAFLRSRGPPPDANIVLIERLAARVAGDRELVRVEQLVAESGLGLRALQRLFANYIGVGPKWLIQRYRLHEAIERLADGAAAPDWPSLALALGYFDQAHFIHDFKALVGCTPAQYAARARGGL